MARASCAFRTTGAGSTTLCIASLRATAAVQPRLLEVGVWNTTATAVSISLRRFTVAGTGGAGMTEAYEDDNVHVPVATISDTDTGGPTFRTGALRIATLGAAVGSGVIWTFGGDGAMIEAGTANGIGIVPWVGTGQICDVYFVWSE
jgi:hypothetical protein